MVQFRYKSERVPVNYKIPVALYIGLHIQFFWSLDVMYTQYKIIIQCLMVGKPIWKQLRLDKTDQSWKTEFLASQVSACFNSLQLTAAFHEMVLLFKHVFRSLKETGCHTAGKALPHPHLRARQGISVVAWPHPGPGSDSPTFAMVYGYIHCPIKVSFIHVEMKFICNCVFVLREELWLYSWWWMNQTLGS